MSKKPTPPPFTDVRRFAFRQVAALIESADLEQLFSDEHEYSLNDLDREQRFIVKLLESLAGE